MHWGCLVTSLASAHEIQAVSPSLQMSQPRHCQTSLGRQGAKLPPARNTEVMRRLLRTQGWESDILEGHDRQMDGFTAAQPGVQRPRRDGGVGRGGDFSTSPWGGECGSGLGQAERVGALVGRDQEAGLGGARHGN